MRYRTLKDWQDENSPTKAEEILIAAMQAKVWEPCHLNDGDLPDDDDPAHTIRADLLALLITGGSEACGLSPFGVPLIGAFIKGELRLTHMRAKGDTGLINCRFETAPNLRQARFQVLSLIGSHLPGLNAQGVSVAASLRMDSITATGTVDMGGARIGGQLNFDGATLDGKDGNVLNMQRSIVGAALIWRRVTVQAVRVSLASAKVGDLWDDPQNWPQDLDLDGLTYDRLFNTSTRAKDRMAMLKQGSTFEGQFTPQPYT